MGWVIFVGTLFVLGWFIQFAEKKEWSNLTKGFVSLFIIFTAFIFWIGWTAPPDNPAANAHRPPAAKATEERLVDPNTVPGLSVSYVEAMNGMDRYFPTMQKAVPIDGIPRVLGQSRNGAQTLELMGDQEGELKRAELSFFALSDSPETNDTSLMVLAQFAQNIFPDWDRAPFVLMRELTKLTKHPPKDGVSNKSTMNYGNKVIQFSFIKDLGMFSVDVRNMGYKPSNG